MAKYYWATPDIISKAIQVAQARRANWERVPLNDKIKLFLKAADLVSGKYRFDLNATTMLGQSKTIIQAEIDAAAELADFFRFNAFFAKELLNYQPISEKPNEVLNLFRYRGLEGFVAAISPFNFTAIGGNLAAAPTLVGNCVLWKPSDTALLSNYIIYQLLEEAGFPSGIISFLPSDGPVFGNVITKSSHLAAINFTGSVATFNHIWKEVANNLDLYNNYPRLIGECGGKNFHFVHSSANLDTVVNSTVRSAFEYSGQKCSACSRAYIPQSIWSKLKPRLIEETKNLKLGSALDPKSFLSAVIDEKAFKRISSFIDHAKNSPNLEILVGGKCDNSKGYFIEPTILLTTDPTDKAIREEIFGPVLTVYVYDDSKLEETLDLVRASRYGLTGAIFGEDAKFLEHAAEKLKQEAGNFYVNDKSTGSVVGQQPFGGAKKSGTNDKAGKCVFFFVLNEESSLKIVYLFSWDEFIVDLSPLILNRWTTLSTSICITTEHQTDIRTSNTDHLSIHELVLPYFVLGAHILQEFLEFLELRSGIFRILFCYFDVNYLDFFIALFTYIVLAV